MKKKIEQQTKVVQVVEENIKSMTEDLKILKGDLLTFDKMIKLADSLDDKTEKDIVLKIKEHSEKTAKEYNTIEAGISAEKETLKTEKSKLSKLEKLQKEFNELEIKEVKEENENA